VILQLLDEESTVKPPTGTRRSAGLRRKRNERKHQFAGQILKHKDAAGAAPSAEAAAS
jgi:hypothetical protein